MRRIIIPYFWNSIRSTLQVLCCSFSPQVWWLFPGFCASATDLAASFPKIAKDLCTLFRTRTDLVKDIATGLKNSAELASRNGGSDKEVVATFAKNFLPLFFIKYLEPGCSMDIRACVMNAINAFSSIARDTIVKGLCEKALSEIAAKSLEEEEERKKRVEKKKKPPTASWD